ncbi:MAG: hypothetical protein KGJ89_01210 [Patescibacteria group bacterium]|nr:hypothetical protein [Patescibacteria group bacterium]MDE2015130.1 hypothetical protein [Patescibacteria group bacterium]MDE2226558.1 hypothetical protein [Patescibacteria group bacterium]
MIIFLYGPDDYRRGERKRWYVNEFKKKYSNLSLGIFDLEDSAAPEELKSFARSESLFEPKKLIIVENLSELNEKNEKYFIKEFPPLVLERTTAFLFSERKAPRRAFAFLLEQQAKVEEFVHLTGYEWETYVKKEAQNIGLSLTGPAAQFLADAYRENTWGLITELQKISNMQKGEVDVKDFKNLDLEVAPNYWFIISGLKGASVANRLAALEKILAIGDPPAKIFNILASQWHEKIPRMAEYDLKVKSGKMDYEEALVDLVIG